MGSPPPLPLSRAQGPLTLQEIAGSTAGGKGVHPAIHSSGRRDALKSVMTGVLQAEPPGLGSSYTARRLFPRSGSLPASKRTPGKSLRITSRRSPSWGQHHPNHYEVVAGDNLWEIASGTLKTSDPARIARYWVRIYGRNRDVIGPNPNLVRPGQVLDLPDE